MRVLVIRGMLFVLGGSLVLSASQGQERDENWLTQRVQQIKQSDTTAWQKIPWARSLRAARDISQREGRPLFLFTYDGNLDTGRC